MKTRDSEKRLIDHALSLGASSARMLPVEVIRIRARFADMCKTPRCPGYGQTVNCPPHSMGPRAFAKFLKKFGHAIVFRFDVPTEILLSAERHDVARAVHETAAAIEQVAVDLGDRRSAGLAAGSCKQIFCREYNDCCVLTEGKNCRFPDLARPSMSGLGVDFAHLFKTLGWQIDKITKDTDPEVVRTGLMAGMVLIG